MKPLYIVRHVATPERIACVNELKRHIPDLIVIEDTDKDPMGTFCKALTYDISRPIVQLEDDIELCDDFVNIIERRIEEAPNAVINFFGHIKSKRTRSKWQKGKYFLWLQCTYFPPGYGDMIADYWPIWRDIKGPEYISQMSHMSKSYLYTVDTLFDQLVAFWLDSRNESYYVSLPALVQHLPITSALHSELSVNRQNKTFTKRVTV